MKLCMTTQIFAQKIEEMGQTFMILNKKMVINFN